MENRTAIVLVAKLPIAGKVKTRLFSRYSPPAAATLHELFARHTMNRLVSLGSASPVVLFDPPDDLRAAQALFEADAEYLPQSAGDLGQRLSAAASHLLTRFDRVLFVGCDSPDVPDAHLRDALAALAVEQVVIGPTEDGGFWTVGLDRTVAPGQLLADIPWSTGAECEAVLARAATLHYRTRAVAGWADVDHPKDVDALLWRLEHSSAPADVELFHQLERIASPAARAGEPTHA